MVEAEVMVAEASAPREVAVEVLKVME